MKFHIISSLLVLLLITNLASAVYVEMWYYDLNKGSEWPDREITKIVVLGDYAIPIACKFLFGLDKVWIFNESGLVAEFKLKRPIEVRNGADCNNVDFKYENSTLLIIYRNKTWDRIPINLTLSNENIPTSTLTYGGSEIIEIPTQKPSGYVKLTKPNNSEIYIKLPYPVGAAALSSHGIFIGTKGYSYFNREGTWGEEGPFYKLIAIFYFYKDVPGGYLTVHSNTNGKVIVDGKEVGETPVTIPLQVGKHKVKVISFGVSREYEIQITENAGKTLDVIFPTGYLEITLPINGWIKVDGITVGEASYWKHYYFRTVLPVGTHTVTIYCLGCPNEEFNNLKANFKVEIRENETTKLNITAEMLGIAGYLSVKSNVKARVYLDPRKTQEAGITPIEIPLIGNYYYQIIVVPVDAPEIEKKFDVILKPGERKEIYVFFNITDVNPQKVQEEFHDKESPEMSKTFSHASVNVPNKETSLKLPIILAVIIIIEFVVYLALKRRY